MKKATRPRREADPLVGEPPPRPERSVYDVAVLQKALDVLEIVADGPELGLSELSERSGASKASNYRILSTLESRGFLVKDPATRKYSPGPRLIAVAYGVIGRVDVVGMARPALEAVRAEFDETVNLGVLVDNQVLYVDILESAQALRMAARPGAKDPLHSTALGKAILSAMSTEDARSILKTYRRTAMTPHTLTSLEALVTELAVIRARGYAIDNEENELGSRCVAVPLLGRAGEIVGAISVSGPAVRVTDEGAARIGVRLLAARQEIERAFGNVTPAVELAE
jgi:DNA-binding IclR family transcriptional regulator